MDFDNSIPIYLQVIRKIKLDIITGKLNPGDKLPSTRDLAKEINVNPNTASRVYKEMEALGLCFKKRGLGTFITESEDIVKTIKDEMASQIIEDFIEGMKKLGFSYDEMIEIIITKKEKYKNYDQEEK
ncbi:GntR family transcriptional regulator [Maledivibacter halophilus]|uniref:Transcriptional regulator, GntR family n=1 Tax=Maledivibacter halophilus TaxID=36842 RepID=A0A1T5KP00_9FIRM|nr:GntR family transcriptional regulator [Maledivibacter halophilus]SKC65484.1 transcriptional regulator, GntR family [Maledivibacter halophilus]